MSSPSHKPFWQTKSLLEMSEDEWESLCDGCAKCCLQQLEDEDSQQLVFTDVACDLLDSQTCRCTDYPNRSIRVPSCMNLNINNIAQAAEFAPPSCAYRLLYLGDDLPDWHHLQSQSKESVHLSGNSVRGRCRPMASISEDDIEDYVVEWPQN